MHCTSVFLAALTILFSHTLANTITFIGSDQYDRWVCWYPNPGNATVPGTHIPPYGGAVVPLVGGWAGQFHTIFDGGDCTVPTIVAEVPFQGTYDLTYFDLSAVDSCCDNSGVHFFYPNNGRRPISGCTIFPCPYSYSRTNDKQTLSTPQIDLTVVVGYNPGGFGPGE